MEIFRWLSKDYVVYEPDVATTLDSLAFWHHLIEEFPLAEKEYGEALEIYRQQAEAKPQIYEFFVATTLDKLDGIHRIYRFRLEYYKKCSKWITNVERLLKYIKKWRRKLQTCIRTI